MLSWNFQGNISSKFLDDGTQVNFLEKRLGWLDTLKKNLSRKETRFQFPLLCNFRPNSSMPWLSCLQSFLQYPREQVLLQFALKKRKGQKNYLLCRYGSLQMGRLFERYFLELKVEKALRQVLIVLCPYSEMESPRTYLSSKLLLLLYFNCRIESTSMYFPIYRYIHPTFPRVVAMKIP